MREPRGPITSLAHRLILSILDQSHFYYIVFVAILIESPRAQHTECLSFSRRITQTPVLSPRAGTEVIPSLFAPDFHPNLPEDGLGQVPTESW